MFFGEVGPAELSVVLAAGFVVSDRRLLSRVEYPKIPRGSGCRYLCTPPSGLPFHGHTFESASAVGFWPTIHQILGLGGTPQIRSSVVQGIAIDVIHIFWAVAHDLAVHLLAKSIPISIGVPPANTTPGCTPTVGQDLGSIDLVNNRHQSPAQDNRHRPVTVENARPWGPSTGVRAESGDTSAPPFAAPSGKVLSTSFAGKLKWHSGLLCRLVRWGRSGNLRPFILPQGVVYA